jgi:hypothetical protein
LIYTILKKKYVFSGKQKIGDPNNWRADVSKVQSISWQPTITIKEGLNKYVKWLKELE